MSSSPESTGDLPHIPEISLERVEASLDRLGYDYAEAREHPDVIRARFDDYRFHFLLTGNEHTMLQTRGRWNHSVDASRKSEMAKMCNEWNMNRVWPKVYVRRETDGLLGVYAETAADFSVGAVDEQIDSAIRCGLRSAIAFFHSLEERLGPELAELDD